jgi:hypothetical protein
MNTETQTNNKTNVSRLTGSLIGGVILVVLGLFALVEPRLDFDLGLYILPTLGIVFLAWGLVTRSNGLLIPGGILLGIGSGVLLSEGPFSYLPENQNAGVIISAFACGWVLISLLSIAVERNVRKMMWWPLIPAAVLGITGASMLQGGFFTTIVDILSVAWPVFMIAAGLYLILRRKSSH